MVETVKIIIFSFTASLGFGIVFRIGKKNLLWAGTGGALTRCVYLLLLEVIEQRILYSLLAVRRALCRDDGYASEDAFHCISVSGDHSADSRRPAL